MGDAKQTSAGLITVEQAAALLMKSKERIRQLVVAGYIPRAGRDQYPLVGVVQGYIRFREDASQRAEPARAKADLDRTRAEYIRQRAEREEARLAPTAEVEAYIRLIVEEMLSQMEALPSHLCEKPEERDRFSAIVASIRRDMDRLMEAHSLSRGDVIPAGPARRRYHG